MQYDVPFPPVNDRVWISMGSNLEQMFASRIEAARENMMAVSAPLMYVQSDYSNEPELVEVTVENADVRPTLVWRLETGFYSSKTEIVDITEANGLTVWHLEVVSQPEMVQRRQFIRVPVTLKANAHFKTRSIEVHVVDLSEGGLKFVSRELYSKPSDPVIHLDLIIDGHMLLVSGTIIRFAKEPNGMGGIALEFNPLRNEDAAVLRRHIFGRQVKIRKVSACT